ncbi:thiamine phosphate synthase, partial [Vibrio fluvialis]|nr:thiamine phosphate synthase [Vibrio fluvialis]
VENEQQFEQAQSLPVDYLGLSAIFATPTKTNTVKHWGLDGLNWAMARSRLPMVAIGGLNTSNIGAVAQTGVQGIALVSAISHAPDPQQAARDLRLLIEQNRPASLVRNY